MGWFGEKQNVYPMSTFSPLEITKPIENQCVLVFYDLTAVPTGTGIKFFLLKMEFFQQVNALQYPLKNGAFNSLKVIEVA